MALLKQRASSKKKQRFKHALMIGIVTVPEAQTLKADSAVVQANHVFKHLTK
jgi:hypothetical protein